MSDFDKTDLSIKNKLHSSGSVAIHRDYLSHCLRWSFATRKVGIQRLNGRSRHILDFGCGKEIPFADTLLASRVMHEVKSYIGVDLNTIVIPSHREALKTKDNWSFLSNTNILDVSAETVKDVNTIVSFEVFEHCSKDTTSPILQHLLNLMSAEDGEFIYSTPCYHHKKGAAKNHINEMTRDYFGWLLEENGYTITENYGTFASQADYKKLLTPAQKEVYDQLSSYHNPSMLANFMAPMLPKSARNNIWVCVRRQDGDERVFASPGERPWGQWDK